MLCVGGAVLDRTYRLAGPLRHETSNPATGTSGFGGVARNVAANLRHLGAEVALVSRVGGDEGGRALVAALDTAGIGRGGVAVVPGAATAEYVAVLTEGGDLAFGVADMTILEDLTPAALAAEAELFAGAACVFAECNLPAESLVLLARRALPGDFRLALDAVSVAKSARLPNDLRGVDVLFLNADEAAAIASRHCAAGRTSREAAALLLAAGAGAVVLTLGSEGALAADATGIVLVPAMAARVVDVTGAGDALVAAVLHGLMRGRDLAAAVALGCAAAARVVAVKGTEGDADLVPAQRSQKR